MGQHWEGCQILASTRYRDVLWRGGEYALPICVKLDKWTEKGSRNDSRGKTLVEVIGMGSYKASLKASTLSRQDSTSLLVDFWHLIEPKFLVWFKGHLPLFTFRNATFCGNQEISLNEKRQGKVSYNHLTHQLYSFSQVEDEGLEHEVGWRVKGWRCGKHETQLKYDGNAYDIGTDKDWIQRMLGTQFFSPICMGMKIFFRGNPSCCVKFLNASNSSRFISLLLPVDEVIQCLRS